MWIIIVLWLGDYLYDFPGTIFLKSENRKKSLGLDLKNMRWDAKAMRSNFSIISINSRHGPFLKSDSMLHPLFTNLLFILLIFRNDMFSMSLLSNPYQYIFKVKQNQFQTLSSITATFGRPLNSSASVVIWSVPAAEPGQHSSNHFLVSAMFFNTK